MKNFVIDFYALLSAFSEHETIHINHLYCSNFIERYNNGSATGYNGF